MHKFIYIAWSKDDREYVRIGEVMARNFRAASVKAANAIESHEFVVRVELHRDEEDYDGFPGYGSESFDRLLLQIGTVVLVFAGVGIGWFFHTGFPALMRSLSL